MTFRGMTGRPRRGANSMGNRKAKPSAKPAGEASAQEPSRKLTRATLIELYTARRYLGLDVLKETGLRMPVEVYFKGMQMLAIQPLDLLPPCAVK
jgi:hypothetical protein